MPLPILLDSKHTLLNKHDGCTKCRKFYVSHQSCDCHSGFPHRKDYKTLTAADALVAKRGNITSTAASSSKSTPKPVAATVPSSDKEDDELSTVAAVLPGISDYESDSAEDKDLSVHDVSALIKSKHLIWHCQNHGLMSDFPVKTRALIDNGAHMVLICPELVTESNLKIHCLKERELIDVALKNGQNSATKLYEYVKHSLTSLDAAWTSKSVKALISLGLCMPVILGLPFLMHNTIVVDHADHTCVDKCANYDLLNPPLIALPPPPKPCLKEQLKETKADKKLVLAKLLLVCNDRFKTHLTSLQQFMNRSKFSHVKKHCLHTRKK